MKIVYTWPNSAKANVRHESALPRLNTAPYNRQDNTVQYHKDGPVEAPSYSGGDWKGDVMVESWETDDHGK